MTSNNSIINKEFSSEFKKKLKEPETTTSMGKKTTTSNMSGNKHMNKLAAEIVKKQDRIDGYIDAQIFLAEKNLQAYIDEKAKEEKEIADLKKQQQDIKNHKTGQLAKVSLYEFVNDWLRPETSFKILSYLSDPHKEGINKVRTHRRYFRKARWGNNHPQKGKWEERRFYLYSDHNEHIPYCNLPLYKEISSPFFKQNPADERAHYEKMSDWARRYEGNHRSGYSITLEKHRNTNPLLYELWKFHRTYETLNKGDKKFIITKADIKKYLTLNKVNNRSLLTKGTKCSEKHGVEEYWGYIGNTNVWYPPQARQELVEALMKI
jgi:hypothetical protein